MEGLFRKGWAANSVQTFMGKMGMGYRRSTVQAVRRKVLNVLKFESFYRRLSANKLPHKSQIEEFSWNRHEKYKVMYTFDVLDEATGEIKPHLGSHYDNSYLTKSQYHDRIEDELIPSHYGDQAKISNIEITQLTHRKDYPW